MKQYKLWQAVLIISFCVFFAGCGAAKKAEEIGGAEYENMLFDTGAVHRIDVTIAPEDWDDLLANSIDKTKYEADVVIDGEKVEDVSFSTKGNSSLFFVAAQPDASRFSFKINFGKFVDGQTYHGLKKLNLNNNFCDATYMKDHFSYGLFRKAGVAAPLTSYTWLTINGNDHGLYLAVEDLSESFLDRNYEGEGVIYKPSSHDLALTLDMIPDILENGLPMASDPHGSDLIYVDDELETYPDIFENAETDSTEEDDRNVVAALKSLSEGTALEEYLDTDEIIRFFAAHNYLLNYDSYTGGMLHNIVLYEDDGKTGFLPWDYNLAFATFVPGIGKDVLKDPTDVLNKGIDTPLIGTDEDSRPMWKWIESDDTYREKYHDALDELIAGYYESGEFEKEIDDLTEMLLPYVEKDPTAFYSADEFKKACATLKDFSLRRAESIRKQLDGELPADGSKQADGDKVDASDLNIMDMGAFDAGPDPDEEEASQEESAETLPEASADGSGSAA